MTLVGVPTHLVESLVRPTHDYVLVRLDPRLDKSPGGMEIPHQSRPPARTGVVVRIGPGAFTDGGTDVLPLGVSVGDRILFERAAGKGLPRVPRETTEHEWGYLLVRVGSVCGIIEAEGFSQSERRRLNSGDGGLPAKPAGSDVDVTPANLLRLHALAVKGERPEVLRPVQDWLLVRGDEQETNTGGGGGSVLAPRKRLLDRRGVELPESAQQTRAESYDLWSFRVLARGPGLLWGKDSESRIPQLLDVGDRAYMLRHPEPWIQGVFPEAGPAPGRTFLIREQGFVDGDWCVPGVLRG